MPLAHRHIISSVLLAAALVCGCATGPVAAPADPYLNSTPGPVEAAPSPGESEPAVPSPEPVETDEGGGTPAQAVSEQTVSGWVGRLCSLPEGAQFDDYFEDPGSARYGIAALDADVQKQFDDLRDSGVRFRVWGVLRSGVPDVNDTQIEVTRLVTEGDEPVVDWVGVIKRTEPGVQFEDYFQLLDPDKALYGTDAFGVDSADEAIAERLADLRGTDAVVHVWGTLQRLAPDAHGFRIQVDRLEIDEEPAPASAMGEPVEGWWGVIVSNPPDAQFDDYFERQIYGAPRYGIEASDPDLCEQIEALRDSGKTVHVYGLLVENVPDAYGRQIVVSRIEVPEEAQAVEIVETPVEGWEGSLLKMQPGSQVSRCFERGDGDRYGVDGATDEIRQEIADALWTGADIRVSGVLREPVPDCAGRQIVVERLEAISEPSRASRNLTLFAEATASSALASTKPGVYDPQKAIDWQTDTSWVEGVEGPGQGEWLMLTFPGTIEVHTVSIDVGFDRDADVFAQNNRLKTAILEFSNGETVTLEFADERGIQEKVFARAPGGTIETTYVKITIVDVYPGSVYDDTCLSEVQVLGAVK